MNQDIVEVVSQSPVWVTPVATLIAAVLGGMIPLSATIYLFERNNRKEQITGLANISREFNNQMAVMLKLFGAFSADAGSCTTSEERHRMLIPVVDSQLDLKNIALRFITESDDSIVHKHACELVDTVAAIQRESNRIPHLGFGDVPIEGFQEKYVALQRKLEMVSLALMVRIGDLRSENNKSIHQHLSKMVHSSD